MKKVLLLLISMAILALGVGTVLPSKWQVERSLTIHAPPVAIYPLIANFKTGWPQWSIFDIEDPDIKYTYSGPEEEMGTVRSWTSQKMGHGIQKIISADPQNGIQFLLIMPQNNFVIKGQLRMEPVGDSTKVTWTDSGDVGANFRQKYMVFFMDRMMGPTFEASLSKLQKLVEKKEP
jgi:hypothetical protein